MEVFKHLQRFGVRQRTAQGLEREQDRARIHVYEITGLDRRHIARRRRIAGNSKEAGILAGIGKKLGQDLCGSKRWIHT